MSLSPDTPIRRSGTELAEHVSLLRRRRVLFLGCLLLGLTAGLALMRVTPPAYTATTQVLVASTGVQEQPNQVTNRQRESLNLDTEAQIAQSAVVAGKAAALLRTTMPEPAEVSVPPNSSVLWISVTAADPATAAAQSTAYAKAYLDHRAETARTAVTVQLRALLAKLKQVNASLGKVVVEMAALRRGSAEHTMAAERQKVLSRQVYTLTMKFDALKTVAVTPGSVISEAAAPGEPSSPSLPLYLGSGLMLGLLAGAGAAYTRDRLDLRLRSAADVERLSGLPVLADLAGPLDRHTLHDLASSVTAACPGERLLVRTVPAGLGCSPVAEPLSASVRLAVLDGTDVADLARADAALLLVGLRRATAADVAAAVRHLRGHGVPVVGVVTTTNPLPPAPERTVPPAYGKAVLEKLVYPTNGAPRPIVPDAPETFPMPQVSKAPGKPA